MPTATKPKRKRVKFAIEGTEANCVFVAGNFNDWNPKKNRLKYKDGQFAASVLLPRGRYEYKFVVDDNWCIDPQCPEWSTNDLGSLNSIIEVN